jgi:hypothetical protein
MLVDYQNLGGDAARNPVITAFASAVKYLIASDTLRINFSRMEFFQRKSEREQGIMDIGDALLRLCLMT